MTIRLPPLRERKQEIAYLFSHLLHSHSGGQSPEVDPRLVEQLCLYDWPFNVRELDFLVRRLLVLHGHEPVFAALFFLSTFSTVEQQRQRLLAAPLQRLRLAPCNPRPTPPRPIVRVASASWPN